MSARCVTVLPLFTRAQTRRLLRQFSKLPQVAPNSMNRYGRRIDGWAAQRWVDRLIATHVAPIAKRCYGVKLRKRDHYAFLVEYQPKKQRSLATHVDSSVVTLNVCLGYQFSGGAVAFENGLRVEHAVGRGLIHHGQLAHKALPLKTGKRVNLIVWCFT